MIKESECFFKKKQGYSYAKIDEISDYKNALNT